MLKKRLFLLPMLCLAALSVACVMAFGFLAQDWKLDYFQQELERSLDRVISVIKEDQPNNSIESIQGYLHNHSLVNKNQRLTVVKNDGVVMGDSSVSLNGLKSMENHKQREEINRALQGRMGISVRHSNTLNTNLIYVAKPLSFGSFDGVVRLAMPLAYAENFVFQLQLFLAGLLTLILFIMLGLGVMTYNFVQSRLEHKQHQLEDDVALRTKEIELLQRLANMLAACNSVREAQQVVEDVIPRILGHVNGAVSMIRSSRNQLEIKLDWGGKWPGATAYAPDECWALRKGKYHLSQDNFASLPCSHMEGIGEHHCLCIPLIAHGNTIGIMHFDMGDTAFDQETMQLAFTVAEHLGLALANLNLQEKLREQAVRDPLTGLHNRRYLEEAMPQEIMRAKRHQEPLSVLMLDMDHFKLFNDNFGHDAGDYVLKSLAMLLNDCLRGEDTACRIGGEEMAVLLPTTDSLAAGVVAKRLCEEVRKMALSFRGQSLGNLTLSIGVASNADAASGEDMLKQADLALYEAKDKGRNQYRYCDASLHDKEAAYLAQIAKESSRAQDKTKYTKRDTELEPDSINENEVAFGSVTNIKPIEND